jgi:hypothetical protein
MALRGQHGAAPAARRLLAAAQGLVRRGASRAAPGAAGTGPGPRHGACHRRRLRPAPQDAARLAEGAEALLSGCGIEPTRRAETLDIAEFEALAQALLARGTG